MPEERLGASQVSRSVTRLPRQHAVDEDISRDVSKAVSHIGNRAREQFVRGRAVLADHPAGSF